MILNCENNTTSKKFYLERAAKRLGVSLEDDGYVLNIEPYQFKKGEKWTGIWEIDLLLDREEMKEENWLQADIIFTAISNIPARLQHFKTELLLQACDPEFKRTKEPEYDVVFAGQINNPCYKERERVYSLIKEHCNFKQLEKGTNFIDLYSLARVQFIRSMKTLIGDGEIAQRFFECLPLGSVLTNYVPDLELTGLKENVDYMAYHCDEEMLDKLKWLIKNPLICKNPPTYDDRLKTICKFAGIPKSVI